MSPIPHAHALARKQKREGVVKGKHLRLDVLEGAGLGGVLVGAHVARAAAAGRDDGVLERRRLEVLGLDLGGVGDVADVARAPAAGGCELVRLRHGSSRFCCK